MSGASSSDPLTVHMAGAEWPRTSRGGIPSYFASLFAALRARADVGVSADAFGDAEPGGGSWGPPEGNLLTRARASSAGRDADVLDRHFAPYGPARGRSALVTHFHGPWALESAASGASPAAVQAKRAWEWVRYRRSAAIVVLSQYFADVLVSTYGVSPEDVVVIPPGADLDRFRPTPIPDGRPRVLTVRRLERRMGIDVLIRSWPAVLAALPDARLDIVGTGSQAAELARLVSDLRLGDSVRLHGAVSDAELAAAYGAATVTAVPTRSLEGFGLVALESLAAGRAPVVTDVGGLPDSVVGLAPDLVVPALDEDVLADRLVRALEGERPDVDACRRHAEEFTWQRCADRHVQLYRSLVR
ncbi:Glycosyl transferase group 1 OS=Tsukamurella paurometabola (strain ATCC 8368 / DSM / CCUG 35730/ CIP 100753 / JCM 10117 / KCTC 9821 / NBRC 16120 / NCIMB 702349 / NCTC 13040) OX=521096 GN=Tpau_1579 PE=4 SV=1 [Tsukamurella paurometabola]|uniref:Glycosyl transferase group 1 n=2 Tax=Tsukamurella paurometabola TaxID=2061 RepID=D5UY93_TSUPD|nr:glycosyl transferase group 1 [Tsukamurella paurometabola DSM 20162]SUP30642.1 GDP-mannose-dependent alpha-(1-6)-phosphatidylinositol monomannoside mannosyltransferase [Tsukamurella paurometabola]